MAKRKNKRNKIYADTFQMKDNYVFYQRLDDDNAAQAHIWKKVYTTAMNEFGNYTQFFNTVDSNMIGNTLINQGYAEQRKELSFLSQTFGISDKSISIDEYPKYINLINELIGMKDDYKALLNYLDENKNKSSNINKEIVDRFNTIFQPILTQNIRSFLNTKNSAALINYSREKWDEEIKDRVSKSLKEAIEQLLTMNDISVIEKQLWTRILNLLNETNQQFQQLRSDIMKRYGLNKAIDSIYKWQKGNIKNGVNSTKGLSDKLSNSFKMNKGKYSNISGMLNEYIGSIAGTYIIGESGTTMSRAVIGTNIARTDAITVYSNSGSINVQNIANALNKEMNESNSLADAERIIDDFYNGYLSKIDNIFIQYENIKFSSINKNFSGFHGGRAQPLRALPSYLDSMGANINGEELVSALYNTIPGAIGQDVGGQLKKNTSLALSELMANFLFDDWQGIGNVGGVGIHMFRLSNVLVPLSYLLIAVGSAVLKIINNPESYFKVNFNLPSSILYPDPINPFDNSIGIKGYWDEQRQAVVAGSTYSVRFLGNFKSIISSLLNSL